MYPTVEGTPCCQSFRSRAYQRLSAAMKRKEGCASSIIRERLTCWAGFIRKSVQPRHGPASSAYPAPESNRRSRIPTREAGGPFRCDTCKRAGPCIPERTSDRLIHARQRERYLSPGRFAPFRGCIPSSHEPLRQGSTRAHVAAKRHRPATRTRRNGRGGRLHKVSDKRCEARMAAGRGLLARGASEEGRSDRDLAARPSSHGGTGRFFERRNSGLKRRLA